MVSNFMKNRPIGYVKYKPGKHHSVMVPGARNLAAYEFQFKLGNKNFKALSLLVQKEMAMFNVTAMAKTGDFDIQRPVIERIVFSFGLK
jgi:hypothetical protein